MEHDDHAGIASFVVPEALVANAPLTLGDDIARHMRARRLGTGEPLRLADGHGRVAQATLVALARATAQVDVGEVTEVAPLPAVHLLVPIADKDRMLWLAEKACEFAVTSWRPVLWRRSRSVNPRGEGPAFQNKVTLRMLSALEQSHGVWLPAIFPDATLDRALAAVPPEGSRFLLDAEGDAAAPVFATATGPITLAIGPEGGFERDERDRLMAAGFVPVSLGPTVLRFETAGVAAAALARAALAATPANSLPTSAE